ncbi:MAG TPA: metallopeptidase TldD-related protein [Acidimicrobiales bacterium]|nr:metallopeptidase TldD-related protein [Acidimicrobiales bacterium]
MNDARRAPDELCADVLDLVGDRAEAIVSATAGESALTRFANSRIHQNVGEDDSSVYLKVVVDGRYASASTTQSDAESLRRLVDRTIEAARLRPPDPDWPGLAPPAAAPGVQHWDDDTGEASPDARAAVVRDFVDADRDLEAAGYCSTSGRTTVLANSAGQLVRGRHTTATINGIHRTGSSDASATFSSARLADLDGATTGAEAATRARATAEGIDLEPGAYEVVLSPSCLANILQFLAYAGFNAKAHLDGTSFAHLGEAQFDASVSIWDDATDPRTLGLPFDHEGTPKRRVDLVDGGITTNLVHDRRTARLAGTASTGHGLGQEAAGAYPSNLFFGEGTTNVDDLIGGVQRGLAVYDFWYTRILDPKTQVVTGLTRNGVFLIEGGKVGPAVRNLRFTQSFVAALGPGKVRGIANDAQIVNGMHVPSVHLATWNFTGGAKG